MSFKSVIVVPLPEATPESDTLASVATKAGGAAVTALPVSHKISIRTVNLNQPWQSIHEDLLALVA